MAKKQPPEKARIALNGVLVKNLLLERQLWLRQQLDPRRDIDAECGHPMVVTMQDYKNLFNRGDVASRVVSVLPEESWKDSPEVFETEDEEETSFEKAWAGLEKEHTIFSALERVDILSGIGQYGILLLGIDDGLELDQPAALLPEPTEPEDEEEPAPPTAGMPSRKLLYVRPFDEELVQITELERNKSNPRFGLPVKYQIRFEDANLTSTVGGISPAQSGASSFSQVVHWTRVIHVADNRMSSNVYGVPRMQKVLNRLLDIKKIVGGSGEMFWKGGFPGLSLEAQVGENENVAVDLTATKAEMERYMNGLQRYIATIGMQAKSLSVEIADPSPHVDGQLKLIAMTLGVPWRVFTGSEAAQLASEQDGRSWRERVDRRRNSYLTPYLIRPLVDRLIRLGVLPRPPEYQVFWPDIDTLGATEKAVVAERQTNAIAKYVQAGADLLIDPFHYLTLVLGLEEDEARSIIEEVEHKLIDSDPALPENQPPPPLPPGNGAPPPRNTRPPVNRE